MHLPGGLGVIQEIIVPIFIPLGCFPGLQMGLSPCDPAELSREPVSPKTLGSPSGSTGSPVPALLPRGFFSKGTSQFVFSTAVGTVRGRVVTVPFGGSCCPFLLALLRGEQAPVPPALHFAIASPRCWRQRGAVAPRTHPRGLGCPLHICGQYQGVTQGHLHLGAWGWQVPAGCAPVVEPCFGHREILGGLNGSITVWGPLLHRPASEPCPPMTGLGAAPVLGWVSCRQHPTLPGAPETALLLLRASLRAAEPPALHLDPCASLEVKPQGLAGLG